VSLTVHGLPSSQVAVLFWFLHPSTASQLSSVQGLLSLQLRAEPPPHVPEVQTSPTVHAFMSSHAWVSLAACLVHAPVAPSQTPVLHWSVEAEQSTIDVAAQVPAMSPWQ
jgi:hypothetical protein